MNFQDYANNRKVLPSVRFFRNNIQEYIEGKIYNFWIVGEKDADRPVPFRKAAATLEAFVHVSG